MEPLSANKDDVFSARNQSSLGSFKSRFNINDYYRKKLIIQERFTRSDEKKLESVKIWKFKNCCLLTLDENNKSNPNNVFNCIKLALNTVEPSKIAAISQFASSRNWQIQFKDESFFLAALGKTVQIDGSSYTLQDANEFERRTKTVEKKPITMNVFLRVHWLPHGFENKVVEFLKNEAKFLTVVKTAVERWEAGKSSIENGIISVKVNYEVQNHESLLEFAGIHRVDGQTALFQISGAAPKCLFCKEFGHMRRDCGKIALKCSSCGKRGHESLDCNWSRRTGRNTDLDTLHDDSNTVRLEDEIVSNITNAVEVIKPNEEIPPSISFLPIETQVEAKEEKSKKLNSINSTIDAVLLNVSSFPEDSKSCERSATCDNLIIKTDESSTFIKPNTFNKIKNSALPANSNQAQSLKKPSSININKWKKLTTEEKKSLIASEFEAEHAAMNRVALEASLPKKQVKRSCSNSNINTDQGKKATHLALKTDDLD